MTEDTNLTNRVLTRLTGVPLVYLAGPYRAATTWEVDQNIQRARQWGARVVQAGAYPVIPHANTAHFDGLAGDQLFLSGTLELARRCDAMLMLPGWQTSGGAQAEREMAIQTGIPVLLGIDDLEHLMCAIRETWADAVCLVDMDYNR